MPIELSVRKDYTRRMPKPAIINTPYPSLAELARIYGISPRERDRIIRSVDQLLVTSHARPTRRRAKRQASARKRRTK